MENYEVSVIGFGPGSTALALAADQTNQLPELLESGAIWFDEKPLRGGKIGEYKIVSNSPVADYREVVRSNGRFASVFQTEIGKWFLEQNPGNQIPLSRVGEFVRELQRQVVTIVANFPRSMICQARVNSIRWDGTNFVSLSVDGKTLASSKKLVLATGASEKILPELAQVQNIFLSSEVLTEERWLSGRVVHVLGSSHSAAAVVWKLRDQGNLTVRKVVVWGRHPPRFFYPSVATAKADGYSFAETDVCPHTNRVNRFGGIRSPYREAMQQGVADGFVEFRRLGHLREVVQILVECNSTGKEVVQATGFRANRVSIIGTSGHGGPLMNNRGHVVVDAKHRIYCQCGCGPIPGAFALGLGHQPVASPELGGEPSYDGPLEGFNIFAGVSGKAVVKGLVGK